MLTRKDLEPVVMRGYIRVELQHGLKGTLVRTKSGRGIQKYVNNSDTYLCNSNLNNQELVAD